MKQSWKPQVRSFWINKLPFWIVTFLICSCIVFSLYSKSRTFEAGFITIIYIAFALANLYKLHLWNAKGYEKITIDSAQKVLIFDDQLILPFRQINSIEYNVTDNPVRTIWMRSNIFDNGRINLINTNAVLHIYVNNGFDIDFVIHNKFAAGQILKTLKRCGFSIRLENERTFNWMFFFHALLIIITFLLYIYYKLKM
ncbi:MAG: hypothetical protein E7Z89_05360 [Cyanobacteria bacterium SIG28]|nr:hypothetical protein [Cyanobacteria bacterium SIG28]